MPYFDDLEFIAADEDRRCRAVVHQRFEGMYNLQLAAAGRLWLGVDEAPEVLLEGPTVFWHDPRFTYRYRPADGQGWHHLWVSFRGERARRILRDGFLGLSDSHALSLGQGEGDLFLQTMRRLVRGVKDPLARPGPRCAALLETLLAETLEANRRSPRDPRSARLEALGRAIRSEPLEAWDFRSQARRMHLSYSHFRRLFRQMHGQSPHQFLLDGRMRKAAWLLASTPWQIKRIADHCGYEPAQFSKLFRKRMGLWPMQYRRSLPTRSPDDQAQKD
jgi:AraC-like DNA-binding protein